MATPTVAERRHSDQHRVNQAAPPSRVVQSGDEEHHAQRGDADPLEDTQGTRLQAQHVLRVVGVP